MSGSTARRGNRTADVIMIGPRVPRNLGPINIEIVDQDQIDLDDAAAAGQDDSAPDDQFDRNLAEGMDSTALNMLAATLLEGIDADLASRRDWEETANKAARYLGVKLEDPNGAVTGDGTITRSVATCMLEANIRTWANARAELLPSSGPVKVRREDVTQKPSADGAGPGGQEPAPQPPVGIAPGMGHNSGIPDDPDLTRDQLADALARDMNHYLTVRDKEYYPDTSKMLRVRPTIGNAFKKVYRCPIRRRPVSVWVRAQDLIVSNDCSHLDGAGRITERIRLQQATMRRLQASGHYLDVPLAAPTGRVTDTEAAVAEIEGVAASPQLPEDFEHLVYECYTTVGSSASSSLIGDITKLERDETGKKPGYPLPYRITIDEDSRAILEIRRAWKKGDPDHHRRTRYVKYGFIPGDGFYDYGLIHLVGNPTQVATMVQRAATDNAIFANFPGGLYLKGPGSRQQNTVLRPGPGEWLGVDAASSQRIQDVFLPNAFHESGAGAMAVVQKSEGDVRRIAGLIDLPIGEGRIGNVPVGTIMSYIESIAQVPGAIHKDDHISQQHEFELLRELFAEEPDALIAGNKNPARRWQTYQEVMDPDLVPAADPNTPSQIHRIAKGQAIVSVAGLPQFNGIVDQRKVLHHVMEVIAGGDGTQFDMPPQQPAPPAPPPQVVAAQIRSQSQAQSDSTKQQTEIIKAQGKQAELEAESREREADRQSNEIKAAMGVDKAKIEATHNTINASLDRAQADSHHRDDAANQAASTAAKFSTPFAGPAEGGGEPGGDGAA